MGNPGEIHRSHTDKSCSYRQCLEPENLRKLQDYKIIGNMNMTVNTSANIIKIFHKQMRAWMISHLPQGGKHSEAGKTMRKNPLKITQGMKRRNR